MHPARVYEIDWIVVGIAVAIDERQEFANSTVDQIPVSVVVAIE